MTDVTTGADETAIDTRTRAIATTCVHFRNNGPHGAVCAAGIAYASVERRHQPLAVLLPSGRTASTTRSLPCRTTHNPAGAVCALRETPSWYEARARALDEHRGMAATLDAMRAVHERVPAADAPDADSEVRGTMVCPRCGRTLTFAVQRLEYARRRVGSVATCETSGCIGWKT